MPRFYHPETLALGKLFEMHHTSPSFQHMSVLRLQKGASVMLFNGCGTDYQGQITAWSKSSIEFVIRKEIKSQYESSINVLIAAAMGKHDKMEEVVQKATELGAVAIQPIVAVRSEHVNLDDVKTQKKMIHWQRIAISACEVSGRATIPIIFPPLSLKQWFEPSRAEEIKTAKIIRETLANDVALKLSLGELSRYKSKLSLLLDTTPDVASMQSVVSAMENKDVLYQLLSGPEGGFDPQEIKMIRSRGFLSVHLGKRILRCETAPLVGLSVLQTLVGDFL